MKGEASPLLLERFTLGPLMANCYLVAGDDEGAVVIDPGHEGPTVLAALNRSGRKLTAVLLTHAHFDHVGGLADLLEAAPAPVFLHPDDSPLLATAGEAAARWGFAIRQPPTEIAHLGHGQTLDLAGLRFECLHTPGHAPGHMAFSLAEAGIVFSGDALFRSGIGRTDLPFGDHGLLLESIRRRLLTLPGDTLVLPGHGPETAIGAEAAGNPFLRSP